MSAPPAFVPMEDLEDEGDAALVDSFFLPGGILDPDDEEDTHMPNVPVFRKPVVTRVPSNPWRDDTPEGFDQAREGNIDIPAFLPNSKYHQETNANLFSSSVKPPPGYTENDRTDQVNGLDPTLLAGMNTPLAQGGVNQSSARHAGDMPDDVMGASQMSPSEVQPELHKRSIDPTVRSLDTLQKNDDWLEPVNLPPRLETISPSQSPSDDMAEEPEEEEAPRELDVKRPVITNEVMAVKLSESSSSDQKEPEGSGEVDELEDLEADQLDEEVDVSEDNDDTVEDNDDVDENEYAEDENDNMEESRGSESPLPLEFLLMDQVDAGRSATSSLSTSSLSLASMNEEDYQQLGGTTDDIDKAEEKTAALDSGVAAVIQDVTATATNTPDHSVCHVQPEDLGEVEAEPPADFQTVWGHGAATLSKWYTGILAVPTTIRHAAEDFSEKSTCYSSFICYIHKIHDEISSKITRFNKNCEELFSFLSDFKEVLAVLSSQLASSLRTMLAACTKVLTVACSILFQVWQYSLIEAIEEANVAKCYLIFYFMPTFCSMLMQLCNVPHWTPHLLTSMAVWMLCHQIEAGPLHLGEVSILQLAKMPAASNDQVVESRPRDQRACKTILRILRFVLPIFFLADGFSTEFGTIMGVSGASRLTTAFMMSLVRKNLVSSPIGWASWAIQVLVATYHPAWSLLDQVVLVVGLSSIRLIRFLEGKRVADKRTERSH